VNAPRPSPHDGNLSLTSDRDAVREHDEARGREHAVLRGKRWEAEWYKPKERLMKAEIFDATNDAYHASEGVSNSKLGDFLDDPLLYYHYHVAKDWTRLPSSPAMEFGTTIHNILPPGRMDDHVIEIPRDVLNKDGERKGKPWSDFAAQNFGLTLLKPHEAEPYREIVKQAQEHPMAWALAEAELIEVNIRWTDAATDLLLRSRLDRLHIARGLIVDAKTTTATDEQSFSNEVARYGYHRQAAFYQQAAFELTGDVMPFVFCAVRKSRPYTVRFYDLSESFMNSGRAAMESGLSRLAESLNTGVWAPPSYGEIQTLSEPKWLTFAESWTA
jgi:hypothetical protein